MNFYCFRGKSPLKLNFIFRYFSSSEFFVVDLIKSLIFLKMLSYFFITSLLSLVRFSVKYSFLLISSNCPINLLVIRYKEFTLLTFTYFKSYSHISNVVNRNIFVWRFESFNFLWIKVFFIDNIIKRIVCAVMSMSLVVLLAFYLYNHNNSFNLLFATWNGKVFFFCFMFYEVKVNINSYK